MIRLYLKSAQRAAHSENARLIDVESLDLSHRCSAKRPRECALLDSADELLSFLRSESLGIIYTANRAHVGGHDDSACDDGSGDGTSTDFIDACQERAPLSAKIFLDVRPAFQSIRGATFRGWPFCAFVGHALTAG